MYMYMLHIYIYVYVYIYKNMYTYMCIRTYAGTLSTYTN